MISNQGCPKWELDASEHNSPKFRERGRKVRARVVSECRSTCPDSASIKSWHKGLFKGFVPLDYYAGEFRQLDPKRPCLAESVGVGRQPGCPFADVLRMMSAFSLGLYREVTSLESRWSTTSKNDLMRELASIVGIAIGSFIHIHPFLNGNGRTSRLLWTGLLSRYRFSPQLSIVRRPGPPYPQVMKAAMSGDYGPAVALVLFALAKTPRVELDRS